MIVRLLTCADSTGLKHQGSFAKVTVALKFNQGTNRKRDVIFFGVLFLVTFFGQAKKVTNII